MSKLLLVEMLAVPEDRRDDDDAMHAPTAGEENEQVHQLQLLKKLILQTCLEKEKTFTPVHRRICADTELARSLTPPRGFLLYSESPLPLFLRAE
ncbi:hypothetical protein SRHO_G00041520 [Serrasalmus rhombeus]